MNIPLDDSAKPVEGLYYPTPVTPEEAFQAIGRLRKEARDEIERLLNFLDDTDNHMEREEAVDDVACDDHELELGEGDDEPSLGSHVTPSGAVSYSMPVSRNGDLDCEGDEHDGAEPDEADLEPSIGYDCELAELDKADEEPSLGWGIDGELGNVSGADREQGEAVARPPERTGPPGVTVEQRGYGGRTVIRGMSALQIDRVQPCLDPYGRISTDRVNTRGLL